MIIFHMMALNLPGKKRENKLSRAQLSSLDSHVKIKIWPLPFEWSKHGWQAEIAFLDYLGFGLLLFSILRRDFRILAANEARGWWSEKLILKALH